MREAPFPPAHLQHGGGGDGLSSRGNARRYQWDVQPAVLRVAASMRARSFKVWVDTEMMSGSTLDAMAAAVEDAYCVLICMTERYKVWSAYDV